MSKTTHSYYLVSMTDNQHAGIIDIGQFQDDEEAQESVKAAWKRAQEHPEHGEAYAEADYDALMGEEFWEAIDAGSDVAVIQDTINAHELQRVVRLREDGLDLYRSPR